MVRCTADLGEHATWTLDSLRLKGPAAEALDREAAKGMTIGDVFTDAALDPALTVEHVSDGFNSVTLRLSAPRVWSVDRAGGLTELAPARD